jgi:hypothetical protein
MTLLAIYPVVQLRTLRGVEWNGSFAYLQGDELIYAAYVNSLREGRPRCNNPYSGAQDRPGAPLGESAYSIQFVPAYVMALAGRALRLSTSGVFALLLVLVALSSSLIIFNLIETVTGDRRLAAAGVLFVLCLGGVPTLWGLLQILRGLPPDFSHLRFLRRFAPGAAFPFFFAFCVLVWRVFTTPRRAAAYFYSLLAGVVFAILVFSYFYCWTAALAWIACFSLLWLAAKPHDCERRLKPLGTVIGLMIAALLPYAWLVSRQASNQVEVTMLAHTHAPDWLRVPQLVSLLLVILLSVLFRRGHFVFRRPASLFAVSFMVLPFVLFNQQIITGLSLQPTHYEVFVANYSVLLSIVLIAGILWSQKTGTSRRLFQVGLIAVSILSISWATFEVARSTVKFAPAVITRDEATPVVQRLALLNYDPGSRAVILATDPVVADYLPTIAPQALLWAPHMYGFAGITPAEDRRRLRAFLYYTGIHLEGETPELFSRQTAEQKYYFSALLGRNRIDRSQSNTWKPIQPNEYENVQHDYLEFVASFNHDTAQQPTLTYVLAALDRPVDLSNLDRWYERDAGEKIGKYVLYRVKLRP